MASLIPGFEYDIFISYRQKDNKGANRENTIEALNIVIKKLKEENYKFVSLNEENVTNLTRVGQSK